MSTRAIYGFIKGNELKCTYNHYDGYPSYLGIKLINELKNYSIEELNKAFDTIMMINNDTDIVPSEILNKLIDKGYLTNLDKNKKYDWYWALHEYQGSIIPYLEWDEDCRYMTDGSIYSDTLYGYFIDLNNNTFITKSLSFFKNEIIFQKPFNYNSFIKNINKYLYNGSEINLNELKQINDDEYLSRQIFINIERN